MLLPAPQNSFLKTLDKRNLINGMGEIVKLAIILDESLFEDLEHEGGSLISNKFQDEAGQTVLDKSIVGMVRELSPNLYETELQRKVDFGHTFSLAIESASGYEVMHGEAVAIDIIFSAYLSFQRGILAAGDLERIIGLYKSLDIPMWSQHITPDLLWNGVEERVMHRDGKQLIPIPKAIGASEFINDPKRDEICLAVESLKKEFAESKVL